MKSLLTQRRASTGAVILLALTSMLPSGWSTSLWSRPHDFLRLVMLPLTRPLNDLGRWVRGPAQQGVDFGPTDQLQENYESDLAYVRQLEYQLDQKNQLIRQLQQTRDIRNDVLLEVADVAAWPNSSAAIQTLTISKGRSWGLRVGQIVVDGANLVGRVSEVGSNTATVQLITSAKTVLGVRIVPPVTGPAPREFFTPVKTNKSSEVFQVHVDRDDPVENDDLAYLWDQDWERGGGFIVGKVTVEPDSDDPLRKIVTVRPIRSLRYLRRVFVLVDAQEPQN